MSILTATQQDALQELINCGVGRSADMLNRMLDMHVYLQVPIVKVLPPSEIQQELERHLGQEQVATVRLKFSGSFSGVAHLVFPPPSASKLVAVLTSEDLDHLEDFDAIKAGTLSEVGNVVLNGVMGAISNLLHQQLKYSIPTYTEEQVHGLIDTAEVDQQGGVLLAQTRFLVEKFLVKGDIILLFNVGSFDTLLTALESHLKGYYEQPLKP